MADRILGRFDELATKVDVLAVGRGFRAAVSTPAERLKEASTSDLLGTELKKQGNKEQYAFCRKIQALIGSALECFDDVGNVKEGNGVPEQNVFDALRLMSSQVSERIKYIRLADRSDAGWVTVQHYTADNLADDSDDEKRIKAAEKRATKKSKASSSSKRGKTMFRLLFSVFSITDENGSGCRQTGQLEDFACLY